MGKGSSLPGVRITDPFRKRHAMAYDLCEDVRLTIEVSPRQNVDGLGGWVVEAHARKAVDRRALLELGETRKDALRAVARAWMAKQGALGFPELDWDAISVALDVRAIGWPRRAADQGHPLSDRQSRDRAVAENVNRASWCDAARPSEVHPSGACGRQSSPA